MNFCGIDGNVTRDIEVSTTPNGNTCAKCCVAHNYYYSDEQKTDYYNIVAWGKLAEKLAKQAKKGTKLVVVGKMRNVSYEAKDGSKKQYLEITAQEIDVFFTPAKVDDVKPATKKTKQSLILEEVDDVLPF